MVTPDVDVRALRHPAHFASDVMSTMDVGLCHQYFHTSLGLPLRYLPIIFSISQALAVGRDMSLQHSFTAY